MSDKLRTERQVTKTATFKRGGYTGTLEQKPGMRPIVNIEHRNTDGKFIGRTLSETMDPIDIEIVASILTGMHSELTAGEADEERPAR